MTEQQLSEIFQKAIHYFERLKEARAIPFIGNYPCNSCETTSSLLACAIQKLSPGLDVLVVKGTQPSSNEMHFWVEAEGIALDPTAHQFSEYDAPIFKAIPNPLQEKFSVIERFSPKQALAKTEELGFSSVQQHGLVEEFIDEYGLKSI